MLIHRKKKAFLSYYNCVVILAFLFMLSKTLLFSENENLSRIIDIMQWPFLLYIASTLVETKIKRAVAIRFLLAMAIIIMFFISYINSGLASLFKFSIIILAAKKLRDYELFRTIRNMYIIATVVIVLLGALRIIPSLVVRRGYFTYGFVHSNVLAMFVFSAVCCDVMLLNKLSAKKLTLYIIVIIAIAMLTDCRSVEVGIAAMIIISVIFSRSTNSFKEKRVFRGMLCSLPILCTLISIYLAHNYNRQNRFVMLIDNLSSTRVFLASRLVHALQLTAFGQDCGDYLMENAYLTVLYAWGVIPGIITIVFYSFAIYKSFFEKHYGITACLIGFAVQGLFEGSTLELFLNLAMLTPFMSVETDKQIRNN